jgi:Trypsin-like serine proteases, typically periplasmic, contain C-terminal PDZ domain
MDNMDFNNRSQTDMNESSIVPQINEQQRNGYINIQNVPVKKSKFKKAAPFIATTLVSAIVGGAAGSAYTNYLISKNSYTSPIMYSTSPGQVKTTNYTSSNSIISRIAEDVGPAVVGIDTEVVTQGAYGNTQTESGSGSGVIFDSKGLIVTNQHVIDGSKKISVTIPGRDPIPAQVLGADAMSDIAVLKISANNLPVAKLGDSSKIRVGDLAVAIGNPLGDQYAGTVTSGIISAVDRKMYVAEGDVSRRYHLIQTDAAINPGNSGGALINENGEVIGINSIKFIGDKVEGMGFAIPINEVKDIVDQLMKNGYVSRPLLGIGAVTVTQEDAQKYKSTVGAGVEEIQKGGAAEAAGLKLKDIITEIDGTKIKTSDDLISLLEKHKVGDTVKLKIWREGNYITISVTLTDSKKFTS